MANGRNTLGLARVIAIMMYLVPLVTFQFVVRLVTVEPLDPDILRVLIIAVGLFTAADYAVSLHLENRLLARAAAGAAPSGRPEHLLLSAAVIVAACGTSIAAYGFIVTLFGSPEWGLAFYAVCALHGLHLLVRWPKYEQAAEQGRGPQQR